MAVGLAGPDGNRSDAGGAGELGVAGEPAGAGDLADELGAVSGPKPGSDSSRGAIWATRLAISASSALIVWESSRSGAARRGRCARASSAQCARVAGRRAAPRRRRTRVREKSNDGPVSASKAGGGLALRRGGSRLGGVAIGNRHNEMPSQRTCATASPEGSSDPTPRAQARPVDVICGRVSTGVTKARRMACLLTETRKLRVYRELSRCRRRDSNPRHADYDSAALTD